MVLPTLTEVSYEPEELQRSDWHKRSPTGLSNTSQLYSYHRPQVSRDLVTKQPHLVQLQLKAIMLQQDIRREAASKELYQFYITILPPSSHMWHKGKQLA